MTGFNRVFILGAGAIGSVYGALLSKKKAVTLIGNKAHVEAIRAKGLKLTGDVNEDFFVEADTRMSEIPPRTLILLTTKAYDSLRAVDEIKSLLREDTVMLILQNGIGNEETIKKLIGEVEVLRGLTNMAAEFLTPGEIRFWKGETIIDASKSGKDIAALFNECSLATKTSENIIVDVWRKLVLNCVVNPLTALLKVRNSEVAAETLAWVRHETVRECLAVAKSDGVALELDFKELDRRMGKYSNLSSTYQDLKKGKRTEIDFLNGKVVKLGAKHGVRTPLNKALTCFVKFLEEKQSDVGR